MATINPPVATPQAYDNAADRFSRGFRLPPYPVLVPALLVALAMVVPLAYLFVRGANASEDAWSIVLRIRTAQILGRTLLLIGTVTLFSVIIALPLAWITVRTDLAMRKVWTVLVALPLVVPSFVGAFLIVSALGPRGILQQLLAPLTGIDRLPDIHGLPGATLSLTLLSFPYIFLTVRGALQNLDPALEEAARGLGHSAWSAFLRVTVPQLKPSIVAGSLLVSLYTLSDFGAVSLMRFPTFTWVIYQQYQSSFDRSIAAVLSLALVLVAGVILVAEQYSRGKRKYFKVGSGSVRQPRTVSLGRFRWIALGFLGFIVVASLLLPMSVLGYWLVRGVAAGEPLLLLWEATRNSLLVSIAGAVATVLLSIPVAVLLVRYPSVFSRVIEPLGFMGYALPGVVVALALVFFGVNFARPVYQTAWVLIFAYAFLFFPVALASVRSALLQINPAIEEAARGLGRNSVEVLALVTVPVMRSGVLMGAGLVFLLTMKELPATLILGPLGFKTLSVAVWSASSEAFFAQAAAPALMLILISAVPMAFLVLRERSGRA